MKLNTSIALIPGKHDRLLEKSDYCVGATKAYVPLNEAVLRLHFGAITAVAPKLRACVGRASLAYALSHVEGLCHRLTRILVRNLISQAKMITGRCGACQYFVPAHGDPEPSSTTQIPKRYTPLRCDSNFTGMCRSWCQLGAARLPPKVSAKKHLREYDSGFGFTVRAMGGVVSDLVLTDARTPIPAPGQRRRPHLKALTSIRFFVALHVALYHLVRPFDLWGPLSGFFSAGYTGVSFFFVLSGFILTYSHADDVLIGAPFRKRFYFSRFARIYPVYLLLTIVAAFVLRHSFDKPIHTIAFVADLLMVQTWSVRMAPFFNVPAWSVSMEAVFYFLFPFVYRHLRPPSRGRAILQTFLFWTLAMLPPAFELWKFPATAWHEGPGLFAYWVRRFPPFSVPEFLAGITVGWIFVLYPPSRRQAVACTCTCIGFAGIIIPLVFSKYLPMCMLHNGLLIPFDGLLLLGLGQPTWLSRALRGSALLLLGEASYSFYLSHFMLGDWVVSEFGVNQGFTALIPKLLLSIAFSISLFVFIERPSRSALLLWWKQRSQADH